MDLRLDDPFVAADFGGAIGGLLGTVGDASTRNWHAKLRKQYVHGVPSVTPLAHASQAELRGDDLYDDTELKQAKIEIHMGDHGKKFFGGPPPPITILLKFRNVPLVQSGGVGAELIFP